jgi:hypothetical protein
MAPKKKSYSAKSARAGKDVGKRGKNFSKIESKAAKRYGSKDWQTRCGCGSCEATRQEKLVSGEMQS